MKIDFYIHLLTFLATIVGFIIGFLNLIVKDYISQIEENTREIIKIRKGLNISSCLSKLEGKFEIMDKRSK